MKTLVSILALAAGSLLLISACQQRKDETSVSQAEAAGPLQVTGVEIRATKTDDVLPQPQTTKMPVVLEIKTRGSSSGSQIEAKLINLKTGQQAGLIEQRIVTDGPSSTRLTFKNPAGWNEGRYLVEIKLDGKLVEQRDFDIFDPPRQ